MEVFLFLLIVIYKCFINSGWCFICSPSPEPCSPSNVSSQLICSAGTAQVTWAASANALSYALTATSNEQTLTCSSPSPNCTLSNLVCGQAYDILVNASDGTCVSNYSAPFRQEEGTERKAGPHLADLIYHTSSLIGPHSDVEKPINISIQARSNKYERII